MKITKISYYLILIILIGISLVSFWVYKNYFKNETSQPLLFKVEKGSIQEIIKTRGEVISNKDFNLEFPFSGIVEKIFVKEGEIVNKNQPLMKLETTDFELEIQKLTSQLNQAKANLKAQQAILDKLKKGTRTEEIQIQKIKVENAEIVFEEAKQDLINTLNNAYVQSDDAIRNKIDQLFQNPRSLSPKLIFLSSNSQLQSDIEWQRLVIENSLNSWQLSLNQLTINSNLTLYIKEANKNLEKIKSFLDKIALIVNNLSPNASISQTTIDGWKLNISTARTNINTIINEVLTKKKTLKTAESNLSLEKETLALKEAGPRKEEIVAQEAEVERAKASIESIQTQIAIVKEKIKKSTLYAPLIGKITKIFLKKQELFKPGKPAITLETVDLKIQADISELDIGKIKENSKVIIQLDAFPNFQFNGKIISVEPKEIIKEGDKYYRINIYTKPNKNLKIRSGMSADLTIITSFKKNILKIPELAVYQKNNKKFVKLFKNNKIKEIEIETGISDGEKIEVIKGLKEGQTIMVSAE